MTENLTVIITTKNRSESLRALLCDLSTITQKLQTSFYAVLIVDDSHELSQIQQNEKVISSFRFAEIYHLNSLSVETSFSKYRYISYSQDNSLGKKEWDAARPKFKGIIEFLNNPVFSSSESVLLLDDDIRFLSSSYNSQLLRLNEEKIFQELFAPIPKDILYARGAKYIGRVDACIDITISHLFSNKPLASNFKTYKGIPTYKSWFSRVPIECCEESPGLSGACLATNRMSLSTILLPPFYNEDWIWLELLSREGGLIDIISEPVIHAGEVLVTYNQALHIKQIEGDIVHAYFQGMNSHLCIDIDDALYKNIVNDYLLYIDSNALKYKTQFLSNKALRNNIAAQNLITKYENLGMHFHRKYLSQIKEKIKSYLMDSKLYKKDNMVVENNLVPM
jgi:hypothetical protein